ncbi:multidrug effflux MFS transporter [Paenibacillus kribbensis]|uniref:multidrug effflux MFS transporter n=1 Tax=Paenibacillus kribbensis TaxID=172713 RepID=UPI002DB66CD6|nr:multidrug effflux MFS transporter [Paenibacillus kribbensis]MEC0236101.1 multidrug effflux MFS transporter [Paenibacillus kribbensis]
MKNMTNTRAGVTLTRGRRVTVIVILGALAALAPFSLDMYLPTLPTLAKDLQAAPSIAQLSLTSCMLGLSFGQLAAGPLSDIHGRRRPLLAGLILYVIVSAWCAISGSIWTFIALRFVQGLAGSFGIVISRAITRDLFSGPELTRFFSLLMLVNGAGPIFAPIVGGQLMRISSWQGVFFVLSLIAVALFFAVFYSLEETLPAEGRAKGGLKQTLFKFRTLSKDRTFMGYALSQGFVLAAMFAYISGSTFVIQDIFGASPQLFSVIFALNGLGLIVAGQITGRLSGKVSEHKLFVSGISLATLSGVTLLVVLLCGGGLYAVLVPLFIVVSSVGIVTTTGFSLAMQKYGIAAGSASALLGLISFILGGLAAPVTGIGGGQSAIPMGLVIAFSNIAAVVCYVTLIRIHPASPIQPKGEEK